MNLLNAKEIKNEGGRAIGLKNENLEQIRKVGEKAFVGEPTLTTNQPTEPTPENIMDAVVDSVSKEETPAVTTVPQEIEQPEEQNIFDRMASEPIGEVVEPIAVNDVPTVEEPTPTMVEPAPVPQEVEPTPEPVPEPMVEQVAESVPEPVAQSEPVVDQPNNFENPAAGTTTETIEGGSEPIFDQPVVVEEPKVETKVEETKEKSAAERACDAFKDFLMEDAETKRRNVELEKRVVELEEALKIATARQEAAEQTLEGAKRTLTIDNNKAA